MLPIIIATTARRKALLIRIDPACKRTYYPASLTCMLKSGHNSFGTEDTGEPARQRCLVVSCHRAPAAPHLRFARTAHVLALLGRTCAFPYLDIVRLHSGRLHVRVPSVLRPGGDLMVKLDSRRNGVPSPMLVSLLRRSTPLPVARPSPARRILGARPFSYLAKQRLHRTSSPLL